MGKYEKPNHVTGKLKLQQRIRNKFGEWQIEERKQRLCSKCVSYEQSAFTPGAPAIPCTHGLLPITNNGEDCPYFEKREVANVG